MAAKGRKSRRRSSRPTSQFKISEGARDQQAPAVIVLNRTAGSGSAEKKWKRIRRELRYWRTMPRVIETERPGQGAEIARAAVARGASVVIAAGGDGTAHEVVQGLMEADAGAVGTAFGHLPLGTGCDLARGLGLPTRPEGLLRGMYKGHNTYVDIGVADMSAGAGTVRRYFLNGATVGLGPAVARRVAGSAALRWLGRHAYSLASLKEILAARPYQITWKTDDGNGADTLTLQLFISNGPSTAGGMRPSPDASFNNGELNIVMVGALSLSAALSQFRRLSKGKPFSHPDIKVFSCRSIDLEGPELEVETDGEIAGGLPARISVRPSGLLLRMPA